MAFAVGGRFEPGNGVHVVCGHTDSPNLRVRPISKRTKEGYLQCSVETYGGGLWHTWFDRDLSLAGRVIVGAGHSGGFVSRLVHIRRPLLRVPNLAIHLNRSANEAFKFNQEDQLQPILGQTAEAEPARRGGRRREARRAPPGAAQAACAGARVRRRRDPRL